MRAQTFQRDRDGIFVTTREVCRYGYEVEIRRARGGRIELVECFDQCEAHSAAAQAIALFDDMQGVPPGPYACSFARFRCWR